MSKFDWSPTTTKPNEVRIVYAYTYTHHGRALFIVNLSWTVILVVYILLRLDFLLYTLHFTRTHPILCYLYALEAQKLCTGFHCWAPFHERLKFCYVARTVLIREFFNNKVLNGRSKLYSRKSYEIISVSCWQGFLHLSLWRADRAYMWN